MQYSAPPHGRPQGSLPHISTTPAPTRTSSLLTAGCGSVSRTTTSASSQADTVRVILTDGDSTNIYSTRTIHDAQAAQNLYNAALALRKVSPLPFSCALDSGSRYGLTFLHNNAVVLQELRVSPTGSRFVMLGEGVRAGACPHRR